MPTLAKTTTLISVIYLIQKAMALHPANIGSEIVLGFLITPQIITTMFAWMTYFKRF